MTHLTVHEWGSIAVSTGAASNTPAEFSRAQANALVTAACEHPLANQHGTNILVDRYNKLIAGQMVGVIAAPGCSLEILPKIDAGSSTPDATVRHRLMRMLDVALGLELSGAYATTMARQADTLLDIIIRRFTDQLLTEVRRGLPHSYLAHEDDLPTLRGRLNVRRQVTTLAVRPDRVACRYDMLSADTALLRIIKACVNLLRRHACATETIRRLDELRLPLTDVSDVPIKSLPWAEVRIDRTNRRWESLYKLARLFLQREWQATHFDSRAQHGITLLFPMNDLFEAYIAALTKRALRGSQLAAHSQGGRLCCLIEEGKAGRPRFQTKPDLLIKHGPETLMVIDTKWKHIGRNSDDAKRGVSQADVYQMMAYARLYRCPEVMLLYPHHAGLASSALDTSYKISGGNERLRVCSVDLVDSEEAIVNRLRSFISLVAPVQRMASEHEAKSSA